MPAGMDRIDAAVIGAGVIGLAVARALARAGRSVVILEREGAIGTGVSARSSEVIHAGLYYPPGSLKERLCIEGRRQLYAFCESHHVPHRRCGKLVIAAREDQVIALEAMHSHAARAGVENARLLSHAEARELEPALDCAAALHSPETGIVDSHALMLALLGAAEDHGAVLARGARVERIARRRDGWRILTHDAALDAAIVVNAAGLGAQDVACCIEGLTARQIPALHRAKGSYWSYAGRVPFSHLVYPLPEPGGLGTHLTLDLGGQARFGPDVEWVEDEDYTVDPARKPCFVEAARAIWPGLDPDRLKPAYAGIRPKLSGPGEPAADFVIAGEESHGLPGLVNLFGIESPGLTASLAIGEHVARLLGQRG